MMDPVFVTGATGYIGEQLVRRLVEEGKEVHALYRSEPKAERIRMDGVRLFRGDILDLHSLRQAMEGCAAAYHTAAFAAVWARDPSRVFRLNVEGALNVVRTACECGLQRVAVTSTAGILGPSDRDPVQESSPPPSSFFTPYEASKQQLEQQLLGRKDPPEIVVVNPTRVYGPGILSESNGVTRMILRYLRGRWRFLPGDGRSSGNYVFVEDVVSGHLLAMANGKAGERYILGGENISYRQLFALVREASGVEHRLIGLPLWLMLAAGHLMKFGAQVSGTSPVIVPSLVKKFSHNWIVSSDRAVRELGYRPLSAREGIARTVEWLQQTHLFRTRKQN